MPAEQPREPIVLTANAIVGGQFIRAGDPTPYEREEDLPEAMKAFIATGEETPFDPGERDIYGDLPRNTRRQIQRLEAIAAEREAAAAAFNTPLPEGAAEVLEAEHAKHIGLAKARMAYNQSVIDSAYEGAAQREEEARTQYYVRRGGAWGHVERAKLKPGETVSARTAKWKP
jgi:hypothetical protein